MSTTKSTKTTKTTARRRTVPTTRPWENVPKVAPALPPEVDHAIKEAGRRGKKAVNEAAKGAITTFELVGRAATELVDTTIRIFRSLTGM